MNILLLSSVQRIFTAQTTALAIFTLLALGTFTAGVQVLSWQVCLLGVIMALGAIFAALNSLYAAVSARTREIAILRALGFPAAPVVVSRRHAAHGRVRAIITTFHTVIG